MTTPAQDLFARALELPESERDTFLAIFPRIGGITLVEVESPKVEQGRSRE